MGACASKDITQQHRDPAQWKADERGDEARGGAVATGSNGSGLASDIVLNALVAYRGTADAAGANGNANATCTDLCVTGWEDGTIKLFDWRRDTVVRTWQPHSRAVNRLVVGARHGTIYSCSRDTTIAAVRLNTASDAESDATQPVLGLRGHTLNVATIAVDADESNLCSGGRDTKTVLWDVATTKAVATNTTAQNVITCSKWLPGERVVVQGSEDLSLKLWDTRSALRTPSQTLRGFVYFPLSVDVSTDAHYLLTASKGFNGVGAEARVWDRRTGKQLLQFDGHQQDATACCFVPTIAPRADSLPTLADTEHIRIAVDAASATGGLPTPVTASKDGTVKVWDTASSAQSGRLLCEAHEPEGRMFTSITSAGGGVLLAGTFSGRVHALEFDADNHSLSLL